MRTLKKSLALVLALVMLLGLGVVGASADNALDNYTDADDIGDAYVEAVGVLTGLGVVDGMTDTTIVPQATYTRAQAAKIIATMVLGVDGAKTCVATTNPFDDVDANHWAAGYIAFCKEEGIIDGVTDTSFDPEGTLTGYQWAKMLLAAVGFNANNELEGASWSLNTARIGHEVGLFNGDTSAADHTPLRREQAMLFAFNALTKVGQVVWSESLGDYIYEYNNWLVDRYTGEGTLGETVFDLTYAYGVITDNEGVGHKTTELSNVTLPNGREITGTINVAANTDLYMMYHAVKQWYVAGKTNTGVYTIDLAKTVSADCATVAAKDYPKDLTAANTTPKNIGEKDSTAEIYEQVVVDNRAYENVDADKDGYVVNYYFNTGVLGTRSEKADTTVVGGHVAKNDNIMTDISKISRNDNIIYLYTDNDNDVFYVYAVGATSGAVKSLAKNGTITLTDGTELKPSVFGDKSNVKTLIEDVLADDAHVTPYIYFTLDSHGHYMTVDNAPFRSVAYFTDAWKVSNPGAWSTDVEYIAQFVDVETGEVEEIPVTAAWRAWARVGNYFDITDELYGDATYSPVLAFKDGNTYGKYNRVASLTLGTTDKTDTDIYYDVSDITFIVSTGAGNNVNVETYEGIDALLDAYDNGRPVSSITLSNACVMVEKSVWGNEYATVVFVYDPGYVTGGIVFFPEDMTRNDWKVVGDDYYEYDSAYINGSNEAENFKVLQGSVNVFDLKAGFYKFTLDADTGYVSALEKLNFNTTTDSSKFTGSGTSTRLDNTPVADDVIIADVRAKGSDIDDIDELAAFWNDYADDPTVQLAYTKNSDGQINVIYVVDVNEFTVSITAATTEEAAKKGTTLQTLGTCEGAGTYEYWNDRDVDVKIVCTGSSLDYTGFEIVYSINGVDYAVGADEITVAADKNSASFEFTVDGKSDIVVYGFRAISA